VAKRVELTEQLGTSTVRLQQLIQKKELRNHYEHRLEMLDEMRKKIEEEVLKRKSLLFRLSEAEERSNELRNNRQNC
jgi:hypothetical protein